MIDWEKSFPIAVSISRKRLKDIGLTDPQIAQITDNEMAWIASIMAQNYQECLYREDLRHLATIVLRDKEKTT